MMTDNARRTFNESSMLFNDQDIFRQYDLAPVNLHPVRQSVPKNQVIEMLDVVKESLERAWGITCGGRKKRLKKLEQLEEVRTRIVEFPSDRSLNIVLENSVASSHSCLPPLFFGKNNMSRVLDRQLASAMDFLNEQTSSIGGGTDVATLGSSLAEDDDELEMMTASSNFSAEDSLISTGSASSSVLASVCYDADSEALLSEGSMSDDVVVTTCNVESEEGPLGVSITTWSRRKLNNDSVRSLSMSMRSKLTEATAQETVPETTETEGSSSVSSVHDEHDNDECDCEECVTDERVEEVTISFDKSVVVRASRTKSVRFSGVKPTTEDNLARAMELLKSARRMREQIQSS